MTDRSEMQTPLFRTDQKLPEATRAIYSIARGEETGVVRLKQQWHLVESVRDVVLSKDHTHITSMKVKLCDIDTDTESEDKGGKPRELVLRDPDEIESFLRMQDEGREIRDAIAKVTNFVQHEIPVDGPVGKSLTEGFRRTGEFGKLARTTMRMQLQKIEKQSSGELEEALAQVKGVDATELSTALLGRYKGNTPME